MSLSNRTFGIELECILPRGTSRDEIARRIEAALAEAGHESGCYNDNGYDHRPRASWKVMTDGSVSPREGVRDTTRGCEVVSPILSGEAGLAEAAVVARCLSDNRASVNKTCGFHLHVYAGDFTADQMRKLALNFVWFEDFFDHIMPPSRRRHNGYYVRSNRARGRSDANAYGTEALNSWFNRLADESINIEFARYTGGFGATEDQGKMERVIQAFVGHERYFKLNLQSYRRQKTVEFRQHSGTVNADKITQWVRLMVGFVEKSRVSKPRPRTVARDLTPQEEMARLFAYMGPAFVSPETVAYYQARRRELVQEVRAEETAARELEANATEEARTLFEALRVRHDAVLAFTRPQRRVAARVRNAMYDLQHTMERADSTPQMVAAAVTRVRSQGLLPQGRTARREAA